MVKGFVESHSICKADGRERSQMDGGNVVGEKRKSSGIMIIRQLVDMSESISKKQPVLGGGTLRSRSSHRKLRFSSSS